MLFNSTVPCLESSYSTLISVINKINTNLLLLYKLSILVSKIWIIEDINNDHDTLHSTFIVLVTSSLKYSCVQMQTVPVSQQRKKAHMLWMINTVLGNTKHICIPYLIVQLSDEEKDIHESSVSSYICMMYQWLLWKKNSPLPFFPPIPQRLILFVSEELLYE